VIIVVGLVCLVLLVVALLVRTHRLPGAHTMPRQLLHRPAPDAPQAPGPRHRADDAHTASIDAGEVLRRLTEEADQRHASMLRRDERKTATLQHPRPRPYALQEETR
jgi:hypothetical protein